MYKLISLALITISLFLPQVVHAEAENQTATLIVASTLVEKQTNPGEVVTEDFYLENTSDFVLSVHVSTADFKSKDTRGTISFSDTPDPFSARTWIKIDPEDLTMAPHSKQTVKMTTAIPKDALAGDRMTAIFFEPVVFKDMSVADGNLVLQSRITSLYFLTVKGKLVKKQSLRSFSIPRILWHGPIPLSIALQNEGNVHFRPTGTVIIRNTMNRQTASILVESQDSLSTLPLSKRETSVMWNPKFPFGVYYAYLTIRDGESVPILAKQWFIVIPYQIVITLIVLSMLSVLAVIVLKSRRKPSQQW